jgi:hypothetical protein
MGDITTNRRPRMRRLLKLGVFLMLGAIVNVAVAWGCALWLPYPVLFTPTPIECPDTWPAYLQESWPAPARAEERAGLGHSVGCIGVSIIDMTSGDAQSSAGDFITSARLTVHRFGIPVRSMRWEEHGLNARGRSIELLIAAADAAGWRKGIRTSIPIDQGMMRRRLPLTAIWPGFAINPIFYAAIIWLLFLGPGKLQRFIRISRGRCQACGYQIAEGVGPVCSECGCAVPAKRA